MFTWKTGKRFIKEDLKQHPFAIDQWVPFDGITILFGPPSIGKSTLLWTMAEIIRKGDVFMSSYQTTKSLCLLLNLDQPASKIHGRMRAGNYEPTFQLTNFDSPINITTWKQDEPQAYERMCKLARRCSVVMIDNLSTICRGMSLKDDHVPVMVHDALKKIFPKQAIVLLHHSRKQLITPTGPVAPHTEDFLGSQFWMSNCQSMIQLYKKNEAMAHMRVVKSQVSSLGPTDGLDVYVDHVGCKVLLYTDATEQAMLGQLLTAEQSMIKINPSYTNLKKNGPGGRYELIGKFWNQSESWAKKWILRTKYKML